MSTWIFQGSLKYFDINSYVANGGNINWHVKAKKHQDEIKVGDRVFIWRTEGKDKNPGGIIAYTKVIKPAYFDDKSKQFKVDLEVIESRLDEESNMLLRSNLKECVRTKFLTILRSPQGTNFYCSDEEGEALLSFWNNPSLLKEEISKNIIYQYLSIYKKEADNYLKNCDLVKVNYEFFSNFKAEENLENLNWEEIQQIGEHLNSLSMGIARKRALGRPNASIEKYRESFKYLFYSKDSLKEKINNFLNNDEYKLFGLGVSVISEIFGYVFADEVCFFNLRDEVAVKEIFNIDLNYKRGDNFGEKYEKFQRALSDNDIVEKYLTIVGRKTTLPVYLELDQFFSYVYEKYSKYIKVEEEPIDEAEDSTVINEAAGIEYSNEVNIEEYNIEDFLREIFIDREEAEELIELLEYKNNIILQGPPGVGKTFIGK